MFYFTTTLFDLILLPNCRTRWHVNVGGLCFLLIMNSTVQSLAGDRETTMLLLYKSVNSTVVLPTAVVRTRVDRSYWYVATVL